MKKAISSIIGLLIFIFPLSFYSYALDIAVIVNASGPLINASKSDVKDIYLGDKRYEGGIQIVPFLFPEGGIKEIFLKDMLIMTPKQFKVYWTRKMFQDGVPVPKTYVHPSDILNLVRNNKGGIGFLPKEAIDDLNALKVIMIIK
ncbi:MAG: hypothetical protein HZA08_08040 [Nitrospirae bacterium]|nr:hypothetical protein [Nitrospirota bacterium]